MKVLGAIIAGGKSSRMGQDKALIAWQGRPLIVHVAMRLLPQVDELLVNANEPLLSRLVPLIPAEAGKAVHAVPDLLPLGTPLAGLHAALHFAKTHGFAAVLSSACDTPLVPLDLRQRLEGDAPAIAASQGQSHYLTGFWPVALLGALDAGCAAGLFRVKDWAAACGAREVAWSGDDLFININTPDDLARLEGHRCFPAGPSGRGSAS